ncbi:MAG: hypothetical protein R2764_00035 [Bacteroidales bacterium]
MKTIFNLFVFITSVILITSCSKDDEDSKSKTKAKLIGLWENKEYCTNVDGRGNYWWFFEGEEQDHCTTFVTDCNSACYSPYGIFFHTYFEVIDDSTIKITYWDISQYCNKLVNYITRLCYF